MTAMVKEDFSGSRHPNAPEEAFEQRTVRREGEAMPIWREEPQAEVMMIRTKQ